MSLSGFPMENISACCENNEQQSEQDVAKIRVDMVEVGQLPQRMGTQEIEIAKILITRVIQDLQKKSFDNFDSGFDARNTLNWLFDLNWTDYTRSLTLPINKFFRLKQVSSYLSIESNVSNSNS